MPSVVAVMLLPLVWEEMMIIWTGELWGRHEEERYMNHLHSFSTSPSPRELLAFPLYTGGIAAVRVQAGASLLKKGVCGTEMPRAYLCWGSGCVLSAQAPGCRTPCPSCSLCSAWRLLVQQGISVLVAGSQWGRVNCCVKPRYSRASETLLWA